MPERILVIKHGALGDFIFSIGAMNAIRRMHPDAHITLMTMGMFSGIAKQIGCFDDLMIDNRVTYWNLAANYRAIHGIIAGKFDIIYDLQASSRTRKRYAPLVRLFSRYPSTWYTVYHAESNQFRTVFGGRKPVSLPCQPTDLHMVHGKGEHFSELPEHYVMLIPGCSPTHPYKRWNAENYCELARRLAAIGIHSVVIGTKAEQKEIEQIAAASPMVVNFLGKSSLLDIPDLAAKALACVGNDTGPTHMSSFCNTPVISLFSAVTRSSARFLKGVPCAIPLVSPEKDINLITVDQVWQHLEPHLTTGKAPENPPLPR